ncbi:MAG: DNA translocase FtsK, partial [Methylophilaceae bacterium]|nr:DNA translocase FtsK [Methylophilaceae bacterium]
MCLFFLERLIILFFNKKTASTSSNHKPPAEHAGLVKEAWWFFFAVIGVYLVLILATYYPNDPSWSHSASENVAIHNAGGVVGAWMSDMLLYIFGFSAWWWAVFAFYAIWLVYLRLDVVALGRKPLLFVNFFGFGMLLLASSCLEYGHLISLPAQLPQNPGGVLGEILDQLLRASIGYLGATLILLFSMAVGFSLFTGWSWILIVEKFGSGLIGTYQF